MIFVEPDKKVESDEDVESLVAVQKTILSEVNALSPNYPDQRARISVLFDALSRIAQIIGARRQYGDLVDVISALRNCKVQEDVAKELASVADLVELKRTRSEAA